MSSQEFPVAIIGSGNIGTSLMIKIIGKCCATTAYACSTSRRRLSGRSASRSSTSRTTSTRRTSTWSPAAARPRCRSSPRSTSRRWCPMPRSCRRSHPNPPDRAPGQYREFIETTATALKDVGGAQRSKVVPILNPADPPILMRNTVYCLVEGGLRPRRHRGVDHRDGPAGAALCCPATGSRQPVQFETFDTDNPLHIPETGKFIGTRVTAMLQVTGAAHYLPAYAGNLDIMTSAALATAEQSPPIR